MPTTDHRPPTTDHRPPITRQTSLRVAILSLTLGQACLPGSGKDPHVPAEVECYEDGDTGIPECVPRLVITAGAACSGSVGGIPSGCFTVDGGGNITNPGGVQELGDFTCVAGDPCAMGPGLAYCTADYPANEFVSAQVANGLGPDPRDVCHQASVAAAAAEDYDASRSFEEAAQDIEDDVEITCDESFDVLVDAECDDFGNTAVVDTGYASTDLTDIAAVVPQHDLVFYIDPADSTLEITGTDDLTDSVSLDGALYALGSPTRFGLGVAFGGRLTVEGKLYHTSWAGFDVTMDVDVNSGTFTIGSGDLAGVGYRARRASDGQLITQGLGPSEDATGSFDLTAGTWSLSFTETAGGRVVEVHLEGTVVASS